MPEPSRAVSLVAPASSDALQIVRAVASSVAARLDFSFDTVDELRIAVNEAGTLLLEAGGSEIHLEIDPAGPHFVALMWIDVEGVAWPGAATDGTWSWQVIQGLCDEVEGALHDGHPSIRLVRRSAVASGT